MKKMLAVVLAVLMILSVFAGCSNSSAGSTDNGDVLSAVLDEGKLVAAIEVGSEPFTFADVDTGEYIGFNIDIITFQGYPGLFNESDIPTGFPSYTAYEIL